MRSAKKEQLAQECIGKLKKIDEEMDTEEGHYEADSVLCSLLAELGFDDVVEQYAKIPKWYA